MFDTDTDARNGLESSAQLTRRRVLLGASTAVTAAVAGCSGGSDGGDGSGDDSDGGGTPANGGGDGAGPTATDAGSDGGATPTETGGGGPTKEETGEVAENRITRIALVGWASEAAGDRFQVTVTLENTGSETIEPESYTWGLRMYDESGSEVQSGARVSGITLGDNDQIPAGETGEILLEARPDDASAVASYELFLSCQGQYAEGAYCPE